MTGETEVVDEKALWRVHCREAVRKFLMHAVVIDNQPVLGQEESSGDTAKTATMVDDGMGEIASVTPSDRPESAGSAGGDGVVDATASAAEAKLLEKEIAETENIRAHDLNVREISDAFAEQEIACAFVLPSNEDKDEEKIFTRIMAASIPADIVIIDWYLRDKNNPALTKKVLTALAEKDVAEKGRFRLICVYTGQPDIGVVTTDSVAALTAGGLNSARADTDEGCAYGKHHCLLVLNKQDVHGAALPEKILDAFTKLSEGIMPTFALAAVAAIRRNAHHIITRFSSDLDAAYVANRLITDPQSEVSELLREIFVSECDSAIGLEQVADKFLADDKVKYWFANFAQPVTVSDFKTQIVRDDGNKEGKTVTVDYDFLCSVLSNGIINDSIITENGSIGFSKSKRGSISKALHKNGDHPGGERMFARFAALKREAFGNTKLTSDEKWKPSLTLGTLLSHEVKPPFSAEGSCAKKIIRYYYCLTPACDTIRINNSAERNFLLLELEDGEKKANLIVLEPGGCVFRTKLTTDSGGN